ncbi:hypothetical protein [Telluribacter sp.]|jgi:hypothetical protein|uniref:hypothetical protein n=1 Tax=Telluribacter sp. TaxID=1978767 RepID=UPI002E12CCC1|nr:hypothetical protein [Telluribacter sp.]
MKSFKKLFLPAMVALMLAGSMTSCATVFGGKVTESQKRRPAPGEPRREMRIGALVADILLFPLISIPVDLATGAMYKPRTAPTTAQQIKTAETAASEARKN